MMKNMAKQIGVFIEKNTQKIIPEYLVNLDLLIEKEEFNLEFLETNTFEKDFNDIKKTIEEKE